MNELADADQGLQQIDGETPTKVPTFSHERVGDGVFLSALKNEPTSQGVL